MTAGPRLKCYLNLLAFHSMPQETGGFQAIVEAGYEGVQFASLGTHAELLECRALGLGVAASGRINEPSDSPALAEKAAGDGYECVTLHVGWGLEDDEFSTRLIDSILEASARWRVPLYIETHRATICQDMWRTVGFVRRFPDMRFNGDFSHWYAGQEMVYGGFDRKYAFIQPVLERVRFIHGRIANPGCIQVPWEAEAICVDHFRRLWTASFQGFLRDPESGGSSICFAPELLAPGIYYARVIDGKEESDRWQQSLLLRQMARECFDKALEKQEDTSISV